MIPHFVRYLLHIVALYTYICQILASHSCIVYLRLCIYAAIENSYDEQFILLEIYACMLEYESLVILGDFSFFRVILAYLDFFYHV